MGRTYADTLPLPYTVGGPNEGIGDFADGLDADPSLETHKNDLNVLNHRVSRLDTLRRLTRTKTLRVVAAVAMALPAAACADQPTSEGQGGGTVAESTPGPSAETKGNEACGPSAFESLNAAEQAECRALIAGMETDDINRLTGLEQARWASYYRNVALGEKSVLHTVVRTNTLEQPGGAESMALRFITDYQNSVFTLAWHMQNNPAAGQDPRTARALLGSDDKASEGYRAAEALKNSAAGTSLAEFMEEAGQSNRLFNSLFPENPALKKEENEYVVSFTAHTLTPSGTRAQEFSYRLFPYMDAARGSDGTLKEQPDDPNDPLSAISAALGRPLLAGTPQIRDATA